MSKQPAAKQIRCPRCGGPSVFSPDNQYRPFCCERCQLIDLGDWASEKFAIPVEDAPGSAKTEKDSEQDEDSEF